MRALITGGSGFVGRHLAAHLRAETDWEIVALGARRAPVLPGVTGAACDLSDRAAVDAVLRRYPPDIVFHLAARTSVPEAFAEPGATLINNAIAQINLFESIHALGLDPVILVAGSSEVYGPAPPEAMPLDERQPFLPANPYAVSKVVQDMLAVQYGLSHQMRIVRVRPFNHIGPGQSERFVVASFARQIAAAEQGLIEPVVRVGNLDAQRDFLDVRDVVRAYRLVARPELAGEVFNVASGVPRSIRQVLDRLLALARRPIEVRPDPARLRPSDAPVVYGSSAKLQQSTGWEPEIPFEQSLIDTLEDWRERVAREG